MAGEAQRGVGGTGLPFVNYGHRLDPDRAGVVVQHRPAPQPHSEDVLLSYPPRHYAESRCGPHVRLTHEQAFDTGEEPTALLV